MGIRIHHFNITKNPSLHGKISISKPILMPSSLILCIIDTMHSVINFPAFIHICRFISLSPYNVVDVIPNLLKNISIVTSTNLINP